SIKTSRGERCQGEAWIVTQSVSAHAGTRRTRRAGGAGALWRASLQGRHSRRTVCVPSAHAETTEVGRGSRGRRGRRGGKKDSGTERPPPADTRVARTPSSRRTEQHQAPSNSNMSPIERVWCPIERDLSHYGGVTQNETALPIDSDLPID